MADLISVDILDSAEPGGPTPAGILTIDVFVDIDATDAWTASGIRAIAQNGATIRYAAPGEIINPLLGGSIDRNVVALSKPLARDSAARFLTCGAAAGGSFNPNTVTPIATALELNVVHFASPPVSSTTPSADGFIARISLDVGALALPNSAFAIFTPGSQPAGSIPVLVSTANGGLGTVFATFDVPTIRGINWGVYAVVPAPGSLAVLGLAGVVAARRRRIRNR
jgi:hypothetical protein